MANIKSQKKRNITNEKARMRNRAVKSELKTATRRVKDAVAAENGIEGRVIVKFVVEKDGRVTDVQVVRSVDPALDREAVNTVKRMPKWNPGMNNGQPARVWFTLPVNFKLQ